MEFGRYSCQFALKTYVLSQKILSDCAGICLLLRILIASFPFFVIVIFSIENVKKEIIMRLDDFIKF